MFSQLWPALRINIFATIVFGILYPLGMTGLCQLLFPHQANGSLIRVNGKTIGSELIGQNFSKPEYFQPRPSAAGNDGYDATSSAATNYGPTNRKLIDRVKASVEKFRKDNPDYHGPIPADLLTASASGLDPDISPAAAEAQVARVAASRGVPADRVQDVVARMVQNRDFDLLGEPRVNVLKLNLELDRELPKK